MTTDPFLPMDDHSAAVFTAKGIDVTPNKDQGVIKVIFIIFFVLCYLFFPGLTVVSLLDIFANWFVFLGWFR